jgi:signal recognition particle subunit SRP54
MIFFTKIQKDSNGISGVLQMLTLSLLPVWIISRILTIFTFQKFNDMFENLTGKFEKAFKVLKGHGQITEINVAETLKEVRRALLDADVNFKTAKEFTTTVKDKAIGRDVLTTVSPGQLMTKICHEELVELMGGNEVEVNLKGDPAIILMSGLQGSGKTTFTGKLGNYLKKKKGKNVLLVACDVYRPAAIDQLHVLGEQLGLEVYSNKEEKNPVNIAKDAVNYARSKGFNVVIVDTAGRLAVDEQMMNEIADVKAAINPSETLFVVDSMTGQDAVNTAKAFDEKINFDGVVLTKLDGDTRGGAALSIKSVVNKPIKFVGTGEKMDALDVFYPARMADRILGMGDVVSLVELAQEHYNEEEARKLQKKISKNQFDFNDFLAQLQQVKKMGNVKDLMGMIPGMGKAIKDVDIKDDAFKYLEAIITSMTPEERSNPDIINGQRKNRIAAGSGTNIQEVNKLLKQFEDTKKMMKMMSNPKGMAQMMKQMKGMPGIPGM